MRLLRERRRAGNCLVRTELYRTGIDQLVAWGWLDRGDRTNRAAVEEAFNNFMIRAFEQARRYP